MSTLEKTISMMETLPEADLIKIQNLIQNIFRQREQEATDDIVGKKLKPLTREDFLDDIKIAEEEISGGQYRNAEGVFDELEKRYGF